MPRWARGGAEIEQLIVRGELERAAQLVQQIMLRGPQAADGLLALYEATFDPQWFTAARGLGRSRSMV